MLHSKGTAAAPQPGLQAARAWTWFIAASWLTALVGMLLVLWFHESNVGAQATAPPEESPAYTELDAAADQLMLVHFAPAA